MNIIKDRNRLIEETISILQNKLFETKNDNYISRLSQELNKLANIEIDEKRTGEYYIYFDFKGIEFRVDINFKNKRATLSNEDTREKILVIDNIDISNISSEIQQTLEEKFYKNKYALRYGFVIYNTTCSVYYSTHNKYGFTENENEAFINTKETIKALKEEIFDDSKLIKSIEKDFSKFKKVDPLKVSLIKDLTKIVCLR